MNCCYYYYITPCSIKDRDDLKYLRCLTQPARTMGLIRFHHTSHCCFITVTLFLYRRKLTQKYIRSLVRISTPSPMFDGSNGLFFCFYDLLKWREGRLAISELQWPYYYILKILMKKNMIRKIRFIASCGLGKQQFKDLCHISSQVTFLTYHIF